MEEDMSRLDDWKNGIRGQALTEVQHMTAGGGDTDALLKIATALRQLAKELIRKHRAEHPETDDDEPSPSRGNYWD